MYGDPVHYWARLLPSYALGSIIYYDVDHESLIEFRLNTPGTGGDLSPDPWTWRNLKGDIFAMLFNFVFWFMVLFLVEKGFSCGCCKKNIP
jgi:hypothetical protein